MLIAEKYFLALVYPINNMYIITTL